MSITRFGLIGCGWRAEFFTRVAQALPDRFEVERVLIRDPAKPKAQEFLKRWPLPTCATVDELLRDAKMTFVVLSAQAASNPELLAALADRRMPALCETPPARGVPEMTALHELTRRGARIQVAEQLHLRPHHAARIALARSGLLGRVHEAQVAVAHGYHGVSLIRRLLGINFEDATITARRVFSKIVAGPGREGPPTEDKTEDVMQEIAWLDFGDRLGIYDFAGSQYFSWVRSVRTLVLGDRGEIHDEEVRYLKDFRTPVHLKLQREVAGEGDNLEGFHLRGILAGDQWAYTNPFIPARLSDDEIAIASCLEKMAKYAEGGPDFYSLPEACQDHYLGQMISQAARSGERVTTQRQAWAPEP
jgi:predicted dehydrogenase